MKKIFLISLGFAGMVLCLSCNNKKSNEPSATGSKETVSKPASGIAGTYSTTELNMPMQFVLKDDGTGHELYHSENRPITWTRKDGKVYFKYNDMTSEFELPIDSVKGEIHYGSLVYKKE